MNRIILFICAALFLCSCSNNESPKIALSQNWADHYIQLPDSDSLERGKTYLSIYSQIYSTTEERLHNLTSTVSIRNTNLNDTVYIAEASYYNTKGNHIRSYFEKPIYVAPMETIEIVVEFDDIKGGSGGNFVFEWIKAKESNTPFFEGVMISLYGQVGLSFSTQGIEIK
uniref:DUF3124 domain-containing protein n=1 Tax=uncultured Draconibacterium sp. TaxID=1573823 RepID=UPI003217841C